MGVPVRQQAIDLELGKADAVEVDITNLRRLRQQNANLAVSAPLEVLALVFDGATPPSPVRQALALAIDRSASHTVLLQRQGEISGALLPQWISGYSFVFPVARDLGRVRQLGAGAPTLTVGYDGADPLLRAIAERIAVNASEAALQVRAVAGSNAGARPTIALVRLRISSRDPRTSLEDLADQLQFPAPSLADSLFNAERALLGDARVIPLVHVPLAWQLSPKVHGWSTEWRLEDTWLGP
jgi:hypothetical protein